MISGIINAFIVFGFRLWHFLTAGYYKGHGVHSPVVYDFVRNVVYGKGKLGSLPIKLTLGHQSEANRLLSRKYLRLIYRMAHYYQPAIVVDLNEKSTQVSRVLLAALNQGTLFSLINESMFEELANGFSSVNAAIELNRIEDISDAKLALIPNAELVILPCSDNLEKTISDLAFAESKVKKGFIVVEGIYQTDAMRRTWKETIANQTVTLDLFELGIVIKGELLTPGHYRIRF
ncbi:MAG: hypothetical protein IPM71_13840 [Bacteroidota bacterium]|nr:MAG: hypothetical protein IPM71_13840 [Bacteroidota bacterium]